MDDREDDSPWSKKGATLSDKTARKEFGLAQEEIIEAINDGRLRYRVQSIYGNPFLRLIRREVEALVGRRHGGNYLKRRKVLAELARVDKELRALKSRAALLERRKAELSASLRNVGPGGARAEKAKPGRRPRRPKARGR